VYTSEHYVARNCCSLKVAVWWGTRYVSWCIMSLLVENLSWSTMFSTLKRLVYTCEFCRVLQCNFCRKCKLATISLQFLCDSSTMFAAFSQKSLQSCIKFKHIQNLCGIAATNCTEFAASLHLRFLSQAQARQNCMEKCGKNCTKMARINGLYWNTSICSFQRLAWHETVQHLLITVYSNFCWAGKH